MTNKDKNKLIEYWLHTSKDDWKAYESLKRARRFVQALFYLHLTIEKRLKALIVQNTGQHPPMSHSLAYLAGKANLDLPEAVVRKLNVISSFNLESRYPDEKLSFYKTANREFVGIWHNHAKEILTWLDALLKKN